MNQRESKIECEFRKKATLLGWLVMKFVSPGNSGVPDRICIKDGVHVFIEFKRPGEQPTKLQFERHERMKKFGARVFWADSVEQGLRILQQVHDDQFPSAL